MHVRQAQGQGGFGLDAGEQSAGEQEIIAVQPQFRVLGAERLRLRRVSKGVGQRRRRVGSRDRRRLLVERWTTSHVTL